jgi:hypothetical protein
MRRLVLLTMLLAVAWPAAASAAAPCRDRIYNDWYGDGKIATTYPIACYRDALRHVRPDAAIYSSLIDDIKSALQGALERRHGDTKVPKEVGRGLASLGKSEVKAKDVTLRVSKQKASVTKNGQLGTGGTTTVASSSPASGGGGIPTPIIVLGAIALLLAAVGAAGTGYRHFHRRR